MVCRRGAGKERQAKKPTNCGIALTCSILYDPLLKQTPQILQPLLRRTLLGPLLPPHRQIRKIPLLALQLQHLLLEAALHDEPLNLHLARLSQTMHAIDGLSFGGRVELGFHDVGFVGLGEVETEAAGADGDEDDGDRGVAVEGREGPVAGFACHAAVEAHVFVAVVVEGELDEVEVSGPRGEDDAGVELVVCSEIERV